MTTTAPPPLRSVASSSPCAPVSERPARAGRPWGWAATLGWALLVLAARHQGLDLARRLGTEALRLNAPPLVGFRDLQIGTALLVPLAIGVAAIAWFGWIAPRLSWRALVATTVAIAAVWAVGLAVGRSPVKGADPDTPSTTGLTRPMLLPGDEYLLDVPLVGDEVSPFLAGFTASIDDHVTHVRSHPPGFLLVLWGLDRLGLGGAGWAAALVIAGGASVAGAALVSVRALVDEGVARRAAPFLALAPTALWVASTADAFFAGVAAWSVTAVVLATGAPPRRAAALAGVGGVLWGACLLLSYGLTLLLLPIVVVIAARRRIHLLGPVLAGAAALPLLAWWGGFWWPDGLATTRLEYAESVAATRPQSFFVWANLAAVAVAVGPATAAGMARLRDRDLWVLLGGFVGAIAVADLSGLSKGEVERIWLPFTLWLPVAGATLTGRRAGPTRGAADRLRAVGAPWLASQVAVALAVQALVRTRW